MKKKTILILIIIFISGISFSQEKRINDYLSNIISERNIPGIAVSVIENQEVIYSNSFGYSDLENESKVNKQSVFQLASLTKPITALAIMKLVEEEKINLKYPITKYIDSLPDDYKLITVKNLLTHTAGFPDQINLEYDGSPVMDISTKKQLEIILNKPLLFKSGERASYADPGYFLLGMIIEKASGMRYNDYLAQKIFKPLGMINTQVDNKWEIIKNRVAPYRYINNNIINGRRDYQHELPSHFGIISTLEDLTKLDIALRAYQIVSKTTLQKMWNPAKLNNGEDALVWGVNYGFGWMLGDIRGNKYAEHGGFSGTHALHFIDKNLSVIVLTNLDIFSGSDPRSIAQHIAGIVSSDLAKPEKNIYEQTEDNKVTEKQIVSYINSIKNDSENDQLTNIFSKYLNELPNHIKDRILSGLISMEEITMIKDDIVANKNIYKLGIKINSIIHYQFITNNKNSTYAFYITNENKIAWFSKWKE